MKSLSPKELNILHHFINTNCPNKRLIYHETSTSVSTHKVNLLYEILRKEYPEFTGEILQKELIFEKVYPGEEYNDKKLRNIIHELSKIIEFYLVHLDLIQNHPQFRMHLLNQLEKRGLSRLYEIKMNAVEEILDMSEFKDENYFYQKFKLAEKRRIFSENKLAVGKSELTYQYLREEIKCFIGFLLAAIYKHLNLAKYFKEYVKVDIDTDFYDYILRYVNEHRELFELNKSLAIWNRFLLLYTREADKSDLLELKTLLDENRTLFNTTDFKYLYTDILNRCVRLYSKQDTDCKNILSSLLRDVIRKEILVRSGHIHDHNYTAIVSMALELGDFDIAEEFMQNFKKYLFPEFSESTFSYNYAHYYYKLKKYDKALEMLRTVKSQDFYYRIGIYNLTLKMYQETKSFGPAASLAESYRHFLSKNEMIPPELRKNHQNFLKYYKDILNAELHPAKIAPGLLIQRLRGEESVFDKEWLIEQLSSL